MNHERIKYLHGLLVKAAAHASGVQVESVVWRFDGTEMVSLREKAAHYGLPVVELKALEENLYDRNEVPGWEGSLGPFPSQYGQPHVYARDVQSGAGNCVCGRASQSSIHVGAKDVHAGSGAGAMARGVGSRGHFGGICQRANALAYRNRRRRRKQQKENKQ